MSPSRPAGPRSPAPGRPAAPRRTSASTPAATPASRGKPVTAPTATVPQEDPAAFSRAVTTYSAGGARGYSGPVAPPVVSTSSEARFAERSRARRNLARRQVLLVAGSTVVAGALGWLLFFSPVLALDPAQVHIEGAGTVVAVDQVLDVVVAQPDRVQARVTREWPRGIAVVVVAREPVAAVPEQPSAQTPGVQTGPAGFALLDMDGVQVGRVDAPPEGLPVVDVPVGDKRTLGAVLSVLQQLPPDLLAQVGDVSARTQDTVTMNLRDGVRVDWGSAGETPLKIAVLSALRASPAAAGASVIDVSAPRLPITK